MIDLLFTKFFDVKSPLGIAQNENEKDFEYHSIGVDVYMPLATEEFIAELLKKNPETTCTIVRSTKDIDKILSFNLKSKTDRNMIFYGDGVYYIKANLNIPTGIGILIPKNYYPDMRSKSSNFNNCYTSVTGTIDENFTYGMTVQLVKLENDSVDILIHPNEKFAQLVLHKSNFINRMIEVPQNEWQNLEEVQKRRQNRKGGLGHSGKF